MTFTSDSTAQGISSEHEAALVPRADTISPYWVAGTSNGKLETQSVSGQSHQVQPQDPDLAKEFRDYEIVKLNPRDAAAQIRNTGKLSLTTRKGNFDIHLVTHDLRATDYAAQVIADDGVALRLPRTPVNTYKGTVNGNPRAQVRMTVKEKNVEGLIITEGERYSIQPARSLSKNAKVDDFVFYKGSDVTGAGGDCLFNLTRSFTQMVQNWFRVSSSRAFIHLLDYR